MTFLQQLFWILYTIVVCNSIWLVIIADWHVLNSWEELWEVLNRPIGGWKLPKARVVKMPPTVYSYCGLGD